jgi:excisionase family DNA binding protein
LADRYVPRLSLTKAEAAEALGVSLRTFERKVQPNVKVWREGKLRLIPLVELERFLAEHAERVLE